MALNSLGGEKEQQPLPVTLPQFTFIEPDIKEAREAAAIVAERKTIRQGVDAWAEINRAESSHRPC